jgi:hypothetical protein
MNLNPYESPKSLGEPGRRRSSFGVAAIVLALVPMLGVTGINVLLTSRKSEGFPVECLALLLLSIFCLTAAMGMTVWDLACSWQRHQRPLLTLAVVIALQSVGVVGYWVCRLRRRDLL